MLNVYESVKRIFDDNKKVKVQKSEKKCYFVKKDTLGLMKHDEVDKLSNVLVSWYKLRIPDDLFVENKGELLINKNNVNYKNYKSMTFEELHKRNVDLNLLQCKYHNSSYFFNDSLIINIFTTTGLFNNKIDKECKILVDRDNGKILGIEGDYLLPKNLKKNYTNYTLDEILELIKKDHAEHLNYDSLVKYVTSRKRDIITRDKIIRKVCSDLLFSSDEKLEYGYYRASTFLKEMESFLDINFEPDYLVKLLSNGYDNDKNNKKNVNSSLKKLSIN